jgi:hypothetical protein
MRYGNFFPVRRSHSIGNVMEPLPLHQSHPGNGPEAILSSSWQAGQSASGTKQRRIAARRKPMVTTAATFNQVLWVGDSGGTLIISKLL